MNRMQRSVLPLVFALGSLAAPAMVSAHAAEATGSGFMAGLMHPIRGLDHVLAMLSIGLWGSQLGAPGIWVLPVAFPMMMAVGGVLGIAGVPLPGTEIGIAFSVIMLGAVIALDFRPSLGVAVAIAAVFALFHGYAHGVELPAHTGAVAYSAGFVLATGLIHLAGIAIGLVIHLPRGLQVVRTGGAGIAVAGVYLAIHLLAP